MALKYKSKIPSVKLNNNQEIPIIGLGTWKSKPGEVADAVKNAIDAGYRHLDCAMAYKNEREVGQAIKAKIDEGVIKREDLFITSKLWCTYHPRSLVIPTLKQTLSDLGLDYVDLYLIHSPLSLQKGKGTENVPRNPDGTVVFSDVDYLETWLGMEEAVNLGLAKSIGLSNFNHYQIERLKFLRILPTKS